MCNKDLHLFRCASQDNNICEPPGIVWVSVCEPFLNSIDINNPVRRVCSNVTVRHIGPNPCGIHGQVAVTEQIQLRLLPRAPLGYQDPESQEVYALRRALGQVCWLRQGFSASGHPTSQVARVLQHRPHPGVVGGTSPTKAASGGGLTITAGAQQHVPHPDVVDNTSTADSASGKGLPMTARSSSNQSQAPSNSSALATSGQPSSQSTGVLQYGLDSGLIGGLIGGPSFISSASGGLPTTAGPAEREPSMWLVDPDDIGTAHQFHHQCDVIYRRLRKNATDPRVSDSDILKLVEKEVRDKYQAPLAKDPKKRIEKFKATRPSEAAGYETPEAMEKAADKWAWTEKDRLQALRIVRIGRFGRYLPRDLGGPRMVWSLNASVPFEGDNIKKYNKDNKIGNHRAASLLAEIFLSDHKDVQKFLTESLAGRMSRPVSPEIAVEESEDGPAAEPQVPSENDIVRSIETD